MKFKNKEDRKPDEIRTAQSFDFTLNARDGKSDSQLDYPSGAEQKCSIIKASNL